jgi:hypothetical protein
MNKRLKKIQTKDEFIKRWENKTKCKTNKRELKQKIHIKENIAKHHRSSQIITKAKAIIEKYI